MGQDKFNIVDIGLPANWTIKWNKIISLDPENNDLPDNRVEEVWLWHFTQNLVWATNNEDNLALDIGWYPDGELNGRYGLQLIKGIDKDADWRNPLYEFETRSLPVLLQEIKRVTALEQGPV